MNAWSDKPADAAAMNLAEQIARTRYDFAALRVRLGKNVGGKVEPLAYRTAFRKSRQIERIGKGKNTLWPEDKVRDWEQKNMRRAE